MPTSKIIDDIKNKLIKEIINDDLIVQVIDSKDKDNPSFDGSCLTDTPRNKKNNYTPLLFTYIKYPGTIQDNLTFVCIEVNIVGHYNYKETWVKVQIEVAVFSHVDHMRIDDIPQITANRNDYLSTLLEDKIIDTLKDYTDIKLYSNIGRAYNEKFMYRQIIFECEELNVDVCAKWNLIE